MSSLEKKLCVLSLQQSFHQLKMCQLKGCLRMTIIAQLQQLIASSFQCCCAVQARRDFRSTSAHHEHRKQRQNSARKNFLFGHFLNRFQFAVKLAASCFLCFQTLDLFRITRKDKRIFFHLVAKQFSFNLHFILLQGQTHSLCFRFLLLQMKLKRELLQLHKCLA